jgi:NifU-like protein involved in Fe-S cluster formation
LNRDDPRYVPEVRRRMVEFIGAGDLAPGAGVSQARAGDREQGAEVLLQVRVEAGRATELRFRAFGCPHFIASASWLTDRLRGAARAEFADWDWREAATALEVPPAKFGRLLVLQDAVRTLAGNWPGQDGSTV